jgi:hypothetical protein
MQKPLTPLAYWQFLRQFLRGWLTWSGGSIVIGTLIGLMGKSAFAKQFGWQQTAWGLIGVVLALAGSGNVEKNYHAARAETWDGDAPREAKRVWWILVINAVLDAGYIAGGAWLLRQPAEARRGMGAGIILQGSFLVLWDFANAIRVGRMLTPPEETSS